MMSHDPMNMNRDPQPDHFGPLRARIEALWEERDSLSPLTGGEDRLAVETALNELDSGRLRVAEKPSGEGWLVNVWLKQAVLLSFRLSGSHFCCPAPAARRCSTRCH